MNVKALLGGAEVMLVVVNLLLMRKNEALKEIRRCNYDLASALCMAAQGRYRDAEARARQWHRRMRAHMAREPYRPDPAPKPEWQSRMAP